jgi:iron complex outermembrane receptor protein
MYKFILLLSACVCAHFAYSQSASIKGTVSGNSRPVPQATVSLLKSADSSLVKAELADDSGIYVIGNIEGGNYLLAVTAVGYEPYLRTATVKAGDINVHDVVLAPATTTMKEVAITARKPFIEVAMGKTVVNVESSTAVAGGTALELLRRLPGVSVDQGGNISMNGKAGVLVLINDRPTYLSGEQLATYLRTLTAAELSQLELITQPGARYDAAGNVGIINIKLRKLKKAGFNGNVTASYGQGIYANEYTTLLLNYRKDGLNLSLNATDQHAKGFADMVQNQYFSDPQTGSLLSTNNIHSTPTEVFSVSTLRLAADYDVNEKTTIGASVRGTYHPNASKSHVFSIRQDMATNTTTYSDILNPDGFVRKDITANAYLAHKFSKQSTLDINADALVYSNNLHQNFINTITDDNNRQIDGTVAQSWQPSYINVYSLKADHSLTLASGWKVESGAKSSLVRNDNDAQYALLQNNAWVADTLRTNRFVYTENINALYTSVAKDLSDKWSFRGGLRAEQTNSAGKQYVHNNTFERHYLSLFPTAFIDYKADSNNQWELNYGRRLDRPPYQQLNPFVHYSFQYAYTTGNPYLTPMYTQTLSLQHSYKNMLITSLTLFKTDDMITDVVLADAASKTVYSTYLNLASNKSVDLSIIFNRELSKRLTANASFNIYYAKNEGVVGTVHVVQQGIGYEASLYAQLVLGKGWKAEAYLFYSGQEVNSIMGTKGENIYLEGGVSKTVGKHWQLKANFQDPLYRNRQYEHNNIPGYRSDATYRFLTRMFNVAVTYSFGSDQARQQKQSSMEEKRRMKVD